MTESHENLLLLPGLHGVGSLFPPFISAMPPHWTTRTFEYPLDAVRSYEEWTAIIRETLPEREPFVLVAESFSGPIAVKIAATPPPNLRALVLTGTFLSNPVAPLPKWLVRVAKPLLKIAPVPRFILRRFLLSPDSSPQLVQGVFQAVDSLPKTTMVDRIVSTCMVDVREDYRRLTVPTLVLIGRRERLIRPRAVAEFNRLRPDVQIAEFDAPHLIVESKPQESVAAIAQFLQQLPTSEA
ncbi:Alpha/beta hydrolase family protein [Symmachiella dynata]|uniref:alpha/beta fold hydrolase n=1 Tax=Symmachiella dynata TaxID=2527995 RepID=UPI001187FACF|nr:alpha/beta fold hydrolase [Symmachiella dynata]QDT48420.1 Alpha/beta hydrolase family protein [Symmachiella dynata]